MIIAHYLRNSLTWHMLVKKNKNSICKEVSNRINLPIKNSSLT